MITYITVVYNRADSIKACMESVLSQSYGNVEYIVIDGASTDGTLELIEACADRIDYFLSQPDTGIYNAMNKGIALARGRFLCFINSDDECTRGAASAAMEEYRRTGADILCGIRNLYQKGELQDEVTFPRFAIRHSCFRYIQMYHQATYASYELFNRIGGFDEKYRLLADWVWESAAIDAGAKVDFFDRKLANVHYDGASFRGIVERDEEWTRWAMATFPSLLWDDAELLVNCLDRERTPSFSAEILQSVIDRHAADDDLIKAYYETLLLICLEELSSIAANNRTGGEQISADHEGHSPSEQNEWRLRIKEEIRKGKSLTEEELYETKKEIRALLERSLSADVVSSRKQYEENIGFVRLLHDRGLLATTADLYVRSYRKAIGDDLAAAARHLKKVIFYIYACAVWRCKGAWQSRRTMKYMRNHYKNKRKRYAAG